MAVSSLCFQQQWGKFPFSRPTPALTVFRLFDDCLTDSWEVIPQYRFDLHSSNDVQCWGSVLGPFFFYTVSKVTCWNWLLKSLPCFEWLFYYVPQAISWRKESSSPADLKSFRYHYFLPISLHQPTPHPRQIPGSQTCFAEVSVSIWEGQANSRRYHLPPVRTAIA